MKNTIVVGIQSGDEGKAKVVDALMHEYDACVRFSGGPNAGHTVVLGDKKFKLHHIPAGIISNKPSYLASAMLIYPEKLLEEIENLKKQGFDVDKNLKISPDCHVITHGHISLDSMREDTGRGVGSTRRGIGPCSQAKYGRNGIRIETLMEFNKYFADVPLELNHMFNKGKSIIFEGAQGTLLDVDHGTTYPDISTTSNVAGAACSSAGFGPTRITNVIGVFKGGYMTKVGFGPFPTHIVDRKISDPIVEKGNEYGTTTGRKRKIGWLDLPALKYAVRINGCTELAMTKFDVVEGMDLIICVGYEFPGKSNVYRIMPARKLMLEKAKPVYNILDKPTENDIIKLVEDFTECPVRYVSTGPERTQFKKRGNE